MIRLLRMCSYLAVFDCPRPIAGVDRSPAHAGIVLSDFSNFNQTGTYEAWNAGTFTSGATDWRVQASNFGGGWKTLASQIDASAANLIEIKLTANPNNVATSFNLVLFSRFSQRHAARWNFPVSPGAQTLTADLNTPQGYNSGSIAPGTRAASATSGTCKARSGTGAQAMAMDLTFDNISFLVPEPTSITLLGLASAATWGLFRRRR